MTTTTDRTDALVERLFGATLGALELFSVYLGTELGLYRALERHGATDPGRAGPPRRDRTRATPASGSSSRPSPASWRSTTREPLRCRLAPDHARVLADPDDAAHVAPFAHMLAGIGGVLPVVAQAYRTGGGVPYASYGAAFRHGQGHINRPAFTHELPTDWIDAMPDIRGRLRDHGGRVADIGCGQGFSTIAIAKAFPNASVDGIDLDAASIADATRHAAEAGLDGRVRFLHADAAELDGPYDLILILEALHDMARPADALRAARAALAADGAVLVVDEKVAERFTAPGDEVERMMYGWSVTHCLPTQMVEQPSAALGTVMRSHTVRELADQAGYTRVDVLPVENDFFRLYRLHP